MESVRLDAKHYVDILAHMSLFLKNYPCFYKLFCLNWAFIFKQNILQYIYERDLLKDTRQRR